MSGTLPKLATGVAALALSSAFAAKLAPGMTPDLVGPGECVATVVANAGGPGSKPGFSNEGDDKKGLTLTYSGSKDGFERTAVLKHRPDATVRTLKTSVTTPFGVTASIQDTGSSIKSGAVPKVDTTNPSKAPEASVETASALARKLRSDIKTHCFSPPAR